LGRVQAGWRSGAFRLGGNGGLCWPAAGEDRGGWVADGRVVEGAGADGEGFAGGDVSAEHDFPAWRVTEVPIFVIGYGCRFLIARNQEMADPTATVYFVVLLEIDDKQRYDNEYVPAVLKLITKHGGRVVSAVDGAENLEGDLVKGRAVLIEFPSDEALRKFYHDEEYEPSKALRHSITHSQAFIMPSGFHLSS
jgi:uncharacterized protein (DUF1330 family)